MMRTRLVAAGIALACTATATAAVAPSVAVAGGLTFAPVSTTSADWAGWDVTGGAYTSVSARWTQPKATCAETSDADSAFWVGLDGDTSTSVEQTGTQANCVDGVAQYQAWYEFYPAPSVPLAGTVKAGDTMSAAVTYSRTTGRYTLTIKDVTRGWTSTRRGTAPSGTNASAEVVAEAPTDSRTESVTALTDFGTVHFSDVTVNGRAFGSVATPKQITMADSYGDALASASALSGGNRFAVTWRSAGESEPQVGAGTAPDGTAPAGTAPDGTGGSASGWPYGSGRSGAWGGAGADGSGGYGWATGSTWGGGYGSAYGDGYGFGFGR